MPLSMQKGLSNRKLLYRKREGPTKWVTGLPSWGSGKILCVSQLSHNQCGSIADTSSHSQWYPWEQLPTPKDIIKRVHPDSFSRLMNNSTLVKDFPLSISLRYSVYPPSLKCLFFELSNSPSTHIEVDCKKE